MPYNALRSCAPGGHPRAAGLPLLPVDAHPDTLYRIDGGRWRNCIQTYDLTFTMLPTDGISNIHQMGVLSPVLSRPAERMFDSRPSYYHTSNRLGSVITPVVPVTIRIIAMSAQDNFMQIDVSPVK